MKKDDLLLAMLGNPYFLRKADPEEFNKFLEEAYPSDEDL